MGATMSGTDVLVHFETASAAGIAISTDAACPNVTLRVFCPGGGFEFHGGGSWVNAGGISHGPDTLSVLVHPKGHIGAIDRVRYAYADWPVVSIRNADAD